MSAQSMYKSPAGERAVMALYDSMLARWPVPCETFHIPTRYGDTFVIASGEESFSPLVLLHGAGTNSLTWAGDVAEYSRQYRVFAVDLLGEAGKSAANRLSWDSPAYKEAEEALILLMTHFNTRIGSLPIFTDAELQRLKMPVLLLMGDRDTLRDAEEISARMKKQLPQLAVTVIPGGGHALINTSGQILPFLAGEILA